MSVGNIFSNTGRKIVMHRAFESSPTLTSPSYFKVGTGTTTPTEADTALATAITIGGSATKAIVSGYPTFDDTNLQVTIRSLILTTECNANTLTEQGLVNSDGTPLLASRIVHASIAKTTSVQVIYVEKNIVKSV